MHDLMNNTHPVPVIVPGAALTDNTDLVGEVVDRKGYDGLAFFILTGTLAATGAPAATFTALVEHADLAAGPFTPVADADLLGTESAASFMQDADDSCFKIGYAGSKRFVRLTIDPANNDANAYIAALGLLSAPNRAPTDNPPA